MGVALDTQGETERAFKIMQQLAPPERTGHGLAHQWQGAYHGRNFADPQQRKLAEVHLLKALQVGVPDTDLVHGMLGEYYARLGKAELAAQHLSRAVATRPFQRLRYAQALAALGKKTLATEEGQRAANYYKDRAEADIKDRPARLGWADAVVFLEESPPN
jgi:predicted Zn-dependent protease